MSKCISSYCLDTVIAKQHNGDDWNVILSPVFEGSQCLIYVFSKLNSSTKSLDTS